jgi:hypothetical protein
MMSGEQFLLSAQEQSVLAVDELEASWQREMEAADAEGRFTFAGMMFVMNGREGFAR